MEKYTKIIRKSFPELKFSKVKNSSKGVDHEVLILDGKYVFRFPKTPYYKKMIQTEMKLLHSLQKFPVPNYEWKGKDFGGYRIIKGSPLTAQKYRGIKNKNKLHRELASFLTQLHSKKSFPGLKKIALHHSITLLNQRMKVCKKYLTAEQLEFTKRFIKIANKVKFPKYRVVHGDFYHAHILVDNELKGFIDFSDAYIGDPAIDFHYFWNYGEGVAQDIYRKYKGPKDPEFLYRSQLYNYAGYLSALYYSDKEKPQWRKGVLRRIKSLTEGELKLT